MKTIAVSPVDFNPRLCTLSQFSPEVSTTVSTLAWTMIFYLLFDVDERNGFSSFLSDDNLSPEILTNMIKESSMQYCKIYVTLTI